MARIAKDYRFRRGADDVATVVVGWLDLGRKARVVAQDGAGAHWLLEVAADGRLTEVVAGPVTAQDALAAAEAVLAGKDHGAVALITTTLALAVAAQVIREAA